MVARFSIAFYWDKGSVYRGMALWLRTLGFFFPFGRN